MDIIEQLYILTAIAATGNLIWILKVTGRDQEILRRSVISIFLALVGIGALFKVAGSTYSLLLGIGAIVSWICALGTMIAGPVLFKERKELFAFWLAWLVPGLGHLFLRKRTKALIFLGSILGLYLVGLWISNFRTVGFDDNPYYYIGKFGSGVSLFFGWLLGPEKPFPGEGTPMLWFDPGLLYVSVAGLLNLVVAMNVFGIAQKPSTSEEKEVSAEAEAPPTDDPSPPEEAPKPEEETA
jgi:hypothetical protein